MRLFPHTQVTKLATSCAVVLSASATFVTLSAEPAFANGNGSSGRGATRVLTKDSESGRASAPSFEVSSTRESDVTDYRMHHEMLLAAMERRSVVLKEYTRLRDLTAEEIAAEFPNGGHDAAVTDALQRFAQVRDMLGMAQAASDESLMRLTGGRDLSEDALEDLHAILGM